MSDELEPLSDSVKAALADERRAGGRVPPGLQRRIAASVLAASATTAAAGATAGVSKLVVAVVAGSTLAVGLGGGLWLTQRPGTPPPAVPLAPVTAAQPSEVAPPAVPRPPELPPVPEAAQPGEVVPEAAAARPKATRTERDAQLARENALLDAARAALLAQRPADALDLLDRHARLAKRPLLAEEHDALRIRALVLLGRVDDARQRLGVFEKKYPSSPALPALQRALP